MRIIVVSDTHMPRRRVKGLPEQLNNAIRDADLILHAGDWCDMATVDALSPYAPLEGVAGNNDGEALIKRFGYRKIVTVGDVRIGIVHGHGVKGTTESRSREAFARESPDVIVFGHSHIPLLKEMNGILLFNPGSPTDKRRQAKYSFGILEVDGRDIRASHLLFD